MALGAFQILPIISAEKGKMSDEDQMIEVSLLRQLEEVPEPQCPKELFKLFLKLLEENPSLRRRQFLLKWTAVQLGLITATLIGDGENFEELNSEISSFMKKGVEEYYKKLENGDIKLIQ